MSFLMAIISTTLIVTPAILIMLRVAPSRGRYLLWIVLMVALALPFLTFIPRPVEISMPVIVEVRGQMSEVRTAAEPVLLALPVEIYEPVFYIAPPNSVEINYTAIIATIWLAGIVVVLAMQTAKHLKFRRFIRRWSEIATDSFVLEILHNEKLRLGINKPIQILRCRGIDAPMLTGFLNPQILLPVADYDATDLRFILRHELIHHKRRDLWYKLALMLTKAVYWFNPAVYFMEMQANRDIEIICDMLTVRIEDISGKRRYSELILALAAGRRAQSALATCMNGGKKMLKERFKNIFEPGKKRGVALFVLLGILVATAATLIGINFGGEAEAETVAYEPYEPAAYEPETVPRVWSIYNIPIASSHSINYGGDIEYLRREVRTTTNSFTGTFGSILQRNPNFEIEMERSNVNIRGCGEFQRMNADNGFQLLSSANARHGVEQNGNDFLILPHADGQPAGGEPALTIFMSPNRRFGNLDIYVEYGDVFLSDITVTGELRVVAMNGTVTLRNVDYDRERVYIPGYRAQLEWWSEDFPGGPVFHFDQATGGMYHFEDLYALRTIVFDQAVPVEQSFGGVTSINLTTFLDNIRFVPGDGEDVVVRHYEWIENQRNFSVENGMLTLTSAITPHTPFGLVGIEMGWLGDYLRERGQEFNRTIEVIIPRGMSLYSVSASTSAGRIESAGVEFNMPTFFNTFGGEIAVTDSSFSDEASFSVSGGRAAIANSSLDFARVSTSSGVISVEGSTFTTLSMSASSGNANVSLTRDVSNYHIAASMGRFAGLSFNGERIEHDGLRNPFAPSSITFSSSTGSLAITAPTQ
ncbi:MAG: DUF4097 family beta strand repeat-containing protein [Clostridiales bacterium]|jgi:beta-lactamase regulating signal transducer with metallopeptidase domain|nr:DUF4097 family beta strand repeat-containing protein [Clostridiales bacterium]